SSLFRGGPSLINSKVRPSYTRMCMRTKRKVRLSVRFHDTDTEYRFAAAASMHNDVAVAVGAGGDFPGQISYPRVRAAEKRCGVASARQFLRGESDSSYRGAMSCCTNSRDDKVIKPPPIGCRTHMGIVECNRTQSFDPKQIAGNWNDANVAASGFDRP